jgi:ferrous iron transport protein B
VGNLLKALDDVIRGEIVPRPCRVEGTAEFQRAVAELVPMIEAVAPGVPNARWLAIRLLDGDARVQQALLSGELADLMARQRRSDVQFSGRISIEGAQ